MTKTLVAHFDSSTTAQSVVDELEGAGFTRDAVSYVSHDGSGPLADITKTAKPSSGTAKGAAVGGVSGVLLGLAALAIPGIGPIVAAGPIATALAGAGVGAATGGMLGALADMGIPRRDAERWAHAVQNGGTLVLVQAGEDTVARARRILEARKPVEVAEHERSASESGVDTSNPHADNANYGSEGGSSQWAQTVLGPDGVHDRTVSRDSSPVDGDEWSRGDR